MKRDRYDVLVVGGGPGGTPTAMALAAAGRQVLLVEKGEGLGGTCLFEGCIPSKILRESARRKRELEQAFDFGLCLPGGDLHTDWSAIQQRKRHILKRRSQGALHRAGQLPTLEIAFGTARFLDPRRAMVQSEGEGKEIGFGQAVIATGSVPFLPPIPGLDHPCVMDSESILGIDHIPERLVIIGGGPIGVELGQVFRVFGSQVTILEAAPHILGPVDRELAERLQQIMAGDGIGIVTGCRIDDIANTGGGVYVNIHDGDGSEQRHYADTVLVVTGRRPNVEGLGLENTAVTHGPHGIDVDATLQTREAGIHAVGDVIGQPMFAHWATAQGLALARHLLGQPIPFPTPETNTAVIFSQPEIGIAGLTEQQARDRGMEVNVARYDFSQDARAQIEGCDDGLLKIIYDRQSRKVVGVHALVAGAGELMGEAALAVRAGVPMEALAGSIHPHPTLTESFAQAVRAALGARQ